MNSLKNAIIVDGDFYEDYQPKTYYPWDVSPIHTQLMRPIYELSFKLRKHSKTYSRFIDFIKGRGDEKYIFYHKKEANEAVKKIGKRLS